MSLDSALRLFIAGSLALIGAVWIVRRLRSALRWLVGLPRRCERDPNQPGCRD